MESKKRSRYIAIPVENNPNRADSHERFNVELATGGIDLKRNCYTTNRGMGYMSYYYTPRDMTTKIEELRWHFYGKDLVGKLHFIDKLQTRPPKEVRDHARYRKFVNECIRSYNAEVRRHNSAVRMQELRAYFRGLNFPTKLEFIRKLQSNPPEVRNHPKYRRLTNEFIHEYNTEARRRNHILIERARMQNSLPPQVALEIFEAPAPKAPESLQVPQERIYEAIHYNEPAQYDQPVVGSTEDNWEYDAVAALTDAKVEELHHNGASCGNCRHLGREYCDNFGRILTRWMQKGYNVCQNWMPR